MGNEKDEDGGLKEREETVHWAFSPTLKIVGSSHRKFSTGSPIFHELLKKENDYLHKTLYLY